MSRQKRIGIMGGTFDPIHLGHLFVAEEARHHFDLEKVFFIPSKFPPHKEYRTDVTDAELRYMMTMVATISHPAFEVSRIELAREAPSYTYDTLASLKEQHPEAALFFITGLDAILEILTWYKAHEVMENCSFIAASRPGFDRQQVEKKLGNYLSKVHFLESPALAISSSDIRRRVREGMPITYLVTPGVEQLIYKNNLYRG